MNAAKILRRFSLVVMATTSVLCATEVVRAAAGDPGYCVFRGTIYPSGYAGFECYYENDLNNWPTTGYPGFCQAATNYCSGLCSEQYPYGYWGTGAAEQCAAQGLPANGHYNLLCDCH